ncbi:hypothetical protein PC129_g18847 [Phytophthora cactorum]|uniref:Uncharacterized protein n=1 Tax=Phytophthora cactorum TaxID=29920 RepID=A0A329RMJ6_9STRA|nr:hypothetical protein PC111_g19168 [Phytophthora cactorum]KAG2855548.1 hypothetical protein PC113_g12338 [Phytophthora cactorum]KAG2888659.1 hypothetical protein PC114_g18316 [Phytophthora cactorum]KAG2934139.1 hypothetical protein PC115_g5234 [Phytophthora cactorum]KAG2964143.1 hypothetical protein PC118_g20506 [Phytophthora cactorum]
MDVPSTTSTSWYKFHQFYYLNELFTDMGNVRRHSTLLKFKAMHEPRPQVVRRSAATHQIGYGPGGADGLGLGFAVAVAVAVAHGRGSDDLSGVTVCTDLPVASPLLDLAAALVTDYELALGTNLRPTDGVTKQLTDLAVTLSTDQAAMLVTGWVTRFMDIAALVPHFVWLLTDLATLATDLVVA